MNFEEENRRALRQQVQELMDRSKRIEDKLDKLFELLGLKQQGGS